MTKNLKDSEFLGQLVEGFLAMKRDDATTQVDGIVQRLREIITLQKAREDYVPLEEYSLCADHADPVDGCERCHTGVMFNPQDVGSIHDAMEALFPLLSPEEFVERMESS